MNNSKQVNGKSPQKVYSRSDKAITLIALIVTIIVLLILAGVTISMATSGSGVFGRVKNSADVYRASAKNENDALDSYSSEIEKADKEIEKEGTEGGSGSESGGENSGSVTTTGKGTTLASTSFPKISVSGLKYADLDGDGVADGIIVADISKDSTDTTTYKGGKPWGDSNGSKGGNPWGDSDGSFSYTKVTTGLKEYSENTSYKYTNSDGSTVDGTLIKCTNNTGTPRYYIISLADYDSNSHYWYKNAFGKMSDWSTFTSKDFGKGKENTVKMIDRMKNHSDTSKYSVDYGEATTGTNADVWNIIEDKVKEGWFVPSKAEWAAFASYLNTSKTSTDANYYANYGLSHICWASSQTNDSYAWFVVFSHGCMDNYDVNSANSLRLCATF